MSKDDQLLQGVNTALSIAQLLNMGMAFIAAAKQASANGKTHATPEDVQASLTKFDESLVTLDVSITKAQAEGR